MESCTECLDKVTRLHDATLKLDETVKILAELVMNRQPVPRALREYADAASQAQREALDEMNRHLVTHPVNGEGS